MPYSKLNLIVIACGAVLAFLAYHWRMLYRLLPPEPLPESLFAYGNGSTSCQLVRDVVEDQFKLCEDMKLLPQVPGRKDRTMLLSCDPGRREWNTVMGVLKNPKIGGSLWLYSYTPEERYGRLKKVIPRGFPSKSTFHPLGIEFIAHPTGAEELRLFVTNLGEERPSIEILRLRYDDEETNTNDAVIEYVMTIEHPRITAPNSLAAISLNSFYMTQDHRLPARVFGSMVSLLETLFGFPGGSVDLVAFSDPTTHDAQGQVINVQQVSPRIPFANGISFHPNEKEVAVASSHGDIYFFHRPSPPTPKTSTNDPNTASNQLIFKDRVTVPFHPDNLHYDNGRLLVAGHPYFLSFTSVANGKAGSIAGSWVAAIRSRDHQHTTNDRRVVGSKMVLSESYEMETLYQSDGSQNAKGAYGTSCTAIIDRSTGYFFVTGLYERGLLQCRMEADKSVVG